MMILTCALTGCYDHKAHANITPRAVLHDLSQWENPINGFNGEWHAVSQGVFDR